MSAFILGSTGLVGSHILAAANKSSLFKSVLTISRRLPKVSGEKVRSIVEKDSTKWGEAISKDAKGVDVFFSAFGTTIKAAGSAENFVETDYGINYAAAKAAKEAGVSTYVLISSGGSSANSRFLYLKTKGRLEDDIIALEFPETIILRPGILVGDRESSRLFDSTVGRVVSLVRGTPLSFLGYPVTGEDLGKYVVKLANERPATVKGDKPVVRFVGGQEIALKALNGE